MPARARPISPHWIYRWTLANSLSIVHRATGVVLGLGLIALSYWWMALAGGAEAYATAARVFAGPMGLLLLVGISVSFWYHLLNGVRHLFWDAGRGFERNQRHASGWIAVSGALLLTLGTWLLIARRFI